MNEIFKEEAFRFVYLGVFLVSLSVLIGYCLRQPFLMNWGMATDMSMPTAVCFLLISGMHLTDTTMRLIHLKAAHGAIQ